MHDGLAGGETLKFDALFDMSNKFCREVREHRHATQMILKRPAAVGFVKLRAKRLVLEQDVQDITQHLVSDNLGLCNDCGGTRVEIHARHFAE